MATAVLAVSASAGVAAGAPERDTLVRPGVGIGKVRLGMTLAQVRRGLGRPMFVNRNVRLGFGRRYVEYAWDYGWWLVGFEQRRGRLRAVRIEARAGTERTANGIGWGTRLREVLRRYPNARCRSYVLWNGRIAGGGVYIRDAAGRFTFFLLGALEPQEGTGVRPPKTGVTGFIVKEPFPEIGVARIVACPDGWRRIWDSP
jgi:hypothetical protein